MINNFPKILFPYYHADNSALIAMLGDIGQRSGISRKYSMSIAYYVIQIHSKISKNHIYAIVMDTQNKSHNIYLKRFLKNCYISLI